MSTPAPDSGDPNSYTPWRVALAGIILLILLGALSWMMTDAGKSSEQPITKPAGKVVGVPQDQTGLKPVDALAARLAAQPSYLARLNMLAQEACAVDALRLKGDEGQETMNQINLIYDTYNDLDPEGGVEALQRRQDKYCKGEHAFG